MITEHDADCGYLRHRQERETEMAREATCAPAASSHGELAHLYGQRLEEADCLAYGLVPA